MLENFSGATRIYPVVGDPIGQVKSPSGVTRAFENLGADAICVPMQIDPKDFYQFIITMRAMKNVDGIIITVPHKFAAFHVCDTVSERSKFLQSVNTIRRMPDGRFVGDMFDGLGFVAACKDNGCQFDGKRALLVGAGGAGTAIAHAVASAGVKELTIADVDTQRRDTLVTRLHSTGFFVNSGASIATDFDIIINASPMGMRDDDPLPVPVETLRSSMFVGDVVTKPENPALIVHAQKIGCYTSNGAAMFARVRDLMVNFLVDHK